jgi:hypothetical protein
MAMAQDNAMPVRCTAGSCSQIARATGVIETTLIQHSVGLCDRAGISTLPSKHAFEYTAKSAGPRARGIASCASAHLQ